MYKFLRSRKVAPKELQSTCTVDFRGRVIAAAAAEEDIANDRNGNGAEVRFLFHGKKHQSSGEQTHHASFSDVVDRDDRALEHRVTTVFMGWLLESLPFRMAMLVAILVNSLVIGAQTNRYLEENYGSVFVALDKFFLTVFVMEILFKWYHNFAAFWSNGWNIFDFVIVASSLLGPSLTFLSGSRVLRILRVLRALRSLRSISALRGLQIVVHTVLHSIPDMANIVALLFICMFIFAILGSSFFGDDCPRYFGSLGTAMFSLFICVTQDGWMGITAELQQCGNYVLGAIYLLVFITIGAFIFANLVVAVVVTNLEWAIAEQKELEDKQKQSKLSRQEAAATIQTVDAADVLGRVARYQEPLLLPEPRPSTRALEKFFLLLSAIEDNLAEFKQLQDQLGEILQEVKALSSLDDVSDDGVFELSTMAPAGSSVTPPLAPPPAPPPSDHTVFRRRRVNSIATGDALSDLMSMRVNSMRATSIHHLLSQIHTHTPHTLTPHEMPTISQSAHSARLN